MPRIVQPMSPVTITWSFLKPAPPDGLVDRHESAAMRAAGADRDGSRAASFSASVPLWKADRPELQAGRRRQSPVTTWRSHIRPRARTARSVCR